MVHLVGDKRYLRQYERGMMSPADHNHQQRAKDLRNRTPEGKAKEYLWKYGYTLAVQTCNERIDTTIKGSDSFFFWLQVRRIVEKAGQTPVATQNGPTDISRANRKKAMKAKADRRKLQQALAG